MARPRSNRLVAEVLEDRLLYAADTPMAVVGIDSAVEETVVAASTPDVAASTANGREVVLVNVDLADSRTLLADFEAQRDAGRKLDVIEYTASDDGLAMLSQALAARQDVSAVHVIGHGADGVMWLGTARLDTSTLLARAPELAAWSQALAPDADLLLYGCDVAATATGRDLVQGLAALTGADVAASDDATGATVLGGDWTLEVTQGNVTHPVVLSAWAQAQWHERLATYVVTNTADSGAGSLRWAITQANGSAGADVISFAIAGTGVHTIALASALPTVIGTVTIDASTDDSFAANGNRPAVEIDGASAGVATQGLSFGSGSSGSTVRGLAIYSFSGSGVFIDGGAANITVVGNYLGTNATGVAGGLGNKWGIETNMAGTGLVFGTSAAADRNVIVGNHQGAVALYGPTNQATIRGNWMGVGADGSTALGNRNDSGLGAVSVIYQANALVGGTGAGQGNVIAHSTGAAVVVGSDATASVLGNVMSDNGGLGIDLSASGLYPDGTTPNDTGDADAGGNALQNAPVLTQVSIGAPGYVVSGSLSSTASTPFRIEFFANDASGQAPRYLGATQAATGASGTLVFTVQGLAPVSRGETITATATRANAGYTTFYGTSEISPGITVTNAAPVLSTAPALGLTVNENAGAPVGAVGTAVTSLVDLPGGGGYNNVSDGDLTPVTGIAVTSVNTTEGQWWYTLDGGATWTAMVGIGTGNALLLAATADTRVYFQPNPAYDGTLPAALGFQAWDQTEGVAGGRLNAAVSGGASSVSVAIETVTVTVNPVNVAPSVTTSGGSTSFVEGGTAVRVDDGLSVADGNGDALVWATVTLTNYVAGQDVLAYGGGHGLTGSWNAATGILTLTGAANAGNYESALQEVTYRNTSQAPTAGTRTVQFVVNDGTVSSAAAIRSVGVTAVADAPLITGATAFGVVENTAAGAVITTVAVSDVDSSTFTYALSGTDAGRFTIDATGALRLAVAPDFEAPLDAGGDNVYDVRVRATDGEGLFDEQDLAITVSDAHEAPVLQDDTGATLSNTAVTLNVLANDSAEDGAPLQILDVSSPAHGTAAVVGGQIVYTPTAGYAGTDSVTYRAIDGSEGLAHYWGLGGQAVDTVGGNNGTLVNGPTATSGHWGSALQFDGSNDSVTLADVTYSNEFTLSFWFRMADNAGTGYRYIYSHGNTGDPNSLNVYFIEDATVTGSGAKDVLRTYLRDSNDGDHMASLDISAAGLADNHWHQYTLTTVTGSGSTVFIDGVQRATSVTGGNALNPTGPVRLGGNDTADAVRFYQGALDELALYNRALTPAEVAAAQAGAVSQATVALTVKAASAPQIFQPGSGSSATVSLAENQTAVATVAATDADAGDTLSYAIVGGADAASFSIDAGSGVLSFKVAPDFENPQDSGADHVYDVRVRVTDSDGLFDEQDLAVTVTDVGGPLTVTTTIDTLDGDTSSVEALLANRGADGEISLREAISAANATAGRDTIVLSAGTYTITRSGAGENANSTGDFDITGDLTITGAGAGSTVISGNNADAILQVRSGSASITGVTLRDAYTIGTGVGAAAEVLGGASLDLSESVVRNSRAALLASGGALANAGTLNLTNVEIRDNTSAGNGGAILHTGSALTLNGVTLAGNQTGGDGGGIHSTGSGVSLTNVTLSGNTAGSQGGALYLTNGASLLNVTLADNTAAEAGGIYAITAPVTLRNVLLANSGGGSINAAGSVASLGNNLATDTPAQLNQASDRVGANAALNPLADNGGFARTHALAAGSAAIDAGSSGAAPAVDQTGAARQGVADIGAVEYFGVLNTPPVNTVPGLAPQPQEDVSTALPGVSVMDADQGGVSVFELSSVQLSVSAGTLTVTPAGAATLSAGANGSASFTIHGSQADINATLATLRYQGNAHFNGSDTLVVVSHDASGATDTDSLALVVTPVNDAPVGAVIVAGDPTEDETLTADVSAITDADGLGLFTYQWQRNGIDIAGATAATHVLGDIDVGTVLRVVVRYTDGQGSAETLVSGATGPVASVNDLVTGSVTLDGTPVEGGTLTANTTAIADADGLGPFSYQWQRNGVDVAGATSASYTLVDADVGSNLRVVVSYIDGHGTAEGLASAALGPVAGINDAPSGTPIVVGSTIEDQTLTVDTSGMADADGLGVLTYQWQRDGVDLAGATSVSYTLGDADVGSDLRVVVRYTDGQGTAESRVSAAVGPVANINDAPAGPVVIQGVIEEDQVLVADTTALTDADGLGPLAFQWLRDGQSIAGATTASYTLAEADVGHTISVHTQFVDGHGTVEHVLSAASGAVIKVDDAPQVTANALAIHGTVPAPLTLDVLDPDSAPADIHVSVVRAIDGQFIRVADGAVVGTFTLDDVQAGRVVFVASGADTTPVVELDVSDGANPAVRSLTNVQYSPAPASAPAPAPAPAPPADGVDADAVGAEPSIPGPTPAPANAASPAPAAPEPSAASPDEAPSASDVPAQAAVPAVPEGVSVAAVTLDVIGVTVPRFVVGDIDVRPVSRIDPLAPLLESEVQRFDGLSLSDFVRAVSSDDWQRRFDDVQSEIRLPTFERRDVVSVATGVSSAFSVGYVIWLLRGGVLLSSLVSSLPAWHLIDPLPILGRAGTDDDEDEEDVDRLFRRNRPAAPPPDAAKETHSA